MYTSIHKIQKHLACRYEIQPDTSLPTFKGSFTLGQKRQGMLFIKNNIFKPKWPRLQEKR